MRLTSFPFIALLLATPLAAAKADPYTFSTLTIPAANPTSVFGTIAYGINNAGQVVGTYGTVNNGLDGEQGFLLDLATGVATTLSISAPSSPLLGTGLNDTGQVIGFFTTGSGFETQQGAPFLLDLATRSLTNISYPTYPSNFKPTAIDDSGQILGNLTGGGSARSGPFYSQGYLRDLTTGAAITFADPLAPNDTVANGINEHGQVVGYFQVGFNPSGFLFDVATGLYTTLNDPLAFSTSVPNITGTYPQSINNVGQVAGYFFSVTGVTQIGANFYNVYDSSGFVLDPTTGVYTTVTYPGATDTYVESINDAGQIVGYYRNASGPLNAFLATPTASVPEPASVALLAGSLLVVGWARRRRDRQARTASLVAGYERA